MPATQILVVGTPGSGKSSAWEKVNPAETIVITPNAKAMPWGGSKKQYLDGKNRIQTDDLQVVPGLLEVINKEKPHIKNVLIEDLTHFMSARTLSPTFMARTDGKEAFARWSDFAADVAALIKKGDSPDMRDDLTIVYHGHTEMDDSGKIVLQTAGRLLDRDFKIQSYFAYVLHALVFTENDKIVHKFLTNNDGKHEAKTPRGFFPELLVENDMKMIIETIRKNQD